MERVSYANFCNTDCPSTYVLSENVLVVRCLSWLALLMLDVGSWWWLSCRYVPKDVARLLPVPYH